MPDTTGGSAFLPPETAAVPMAVVPVELLERATDMARAVVVLNATDCPPGCERAKMAERLTADLKAALVAACTCGADRTGPSAEAHAADCPAR